MEKEEIRVGNPLTGTNIYVSVGKEQWTKFMRLMKKHKLSVAAFFDEVVDPIVLKCVRNMNVEKLAEDGYVEELLNEAYECRGEDYAGLKRRREG